MKVSHNTKTGRTTITLNWLETRQLRSSLGLETETLIKMVDEAVELAYKGKDDEYSDRGAIETLKKVRDAKID